MNPEKLQENPSYLEKLKGNLLETLEKAKSPKAFASIVGAAALFGVGEGCTVINEGPQMTQRIVHEKIIYVRDQSVSQYQNQFPQYVQPQYDYGWNNHVDVQPGGVYQPQNVYSNNNNNNNTGGHHHHHQ